MALFIRRLAAAILVLLAPCAAQAQAPTAGQVDQVARDVGRLESLRAVKDLQRSYAQYAQFGLWSEMADLFASNGKIVWGDEVVVTRPAMGKWLAGHGAPMANPGALNTELIDDPLVNLSVDGLSAKGRWRGLALRGDGQGRAWIEGGLYENDYVVEQGRWKIATLHYYPQYEGDYKTGVSNIGEKDLPIVPYHFTVDETGIPVPEAQGTPPVSGATLRALADRVGGLNAEVRRAMELMGPQGLREGILNDHLPFDTIVRVMPGGLEAYARGTELAMIGDAGAGTSRWQVTVFRNRFVREDGLWKIREMRITPLMDADHAPGWGAGGALGATRPPMPAFLGPHPASGRPVAPPGLKVTGGQPLTAAAPRGSRPGASDLADVRRRLL